MTNKKISKGDVVILLPNSVKHVNRKYVTRSAIQS